MLERVISQAHANAVSACHAFPPGLAYDECYTWAVAEFVSSSQIAHERSEFLFILTITAAITFVTTNLLTSWSAGPTRE